MNTKSLQPSFLLTALIVVLFAAVRVLFPNIEKGTGGFTFLGAIAVFGGAMFRNKLVAFALPVAIIFLSDLLINRFGYQSDFFYKGWQYVYIAFLLMAVASSFIVRKVTFANIVISSIVTTAIHFVFTSVAYALGGGLNITTNTVMTGTWNDIVTAHVQAIPFEKPLLYSTLLYSAAMFGVFYFVKKQNPSLAYAKA
jgi:hypothetical protein